MSDNIDPQEAIELFESICKWCSLARVKIAGYWFCKKCDVGIPRKDK